ncbi:MAG TPA: HAMP domain-containing sensor histidine kinase [Candidatus Limnocylindria bacterium]|nr:HAMP domain-containing sensor histidine kinase [Candidatus Limnocylindria bacterium]
MTAIAAGRPLQAHALELARRPAALALALALVVGMPTLVATAASVEAARSEQRSAALSAVGGEAAALAAGLDARLGALHGQLVTAAESRLLQVGAARADRTLVATVLQEFHPLLGDARVLFFVDDRGTPLASDPPGAPLAEAARAAYAAPSRAPAVDGSLGAFAAPVRDGFGMQVGSLVATFAPGALVEERAGADVVLIDARGRAWRPGEAPATDRAPAPPGSLAATAPIGGTGWSLAVVRPAPAAPGLGALGFEIFLFRAGLVAAIAIGAYALAVAVRALLRERAALAAANARLAVASRHKTEFLANVNHELRTPLSSILGFAALLEERTTLDGRQARYVRNVREAGDHLLGLVDDILDLAAVESGRLEIRREDVSVRALLAEPLRVARGTAETRDQRLEISDVPEDVVAVDPRRLGHALGLLFSSALDATPAGGTIGVSAAIESGHLVVAVADGGPAVARERAQRLFDVYGRLRDGAGSASGPGLALAKRLVELHGGVLLVDGGVGAGSVVTVRVPARGERA